MPCLKVHYSLYIACVNLVESINQPLHVQSISDTDPAGHAIYHAILCIYNDQTLVQLLHGVHDVILCHGDHGMTRTSDPRFRKPMLYPAELRDQ